MTVSSSTSSVSYAGNGVTVLFAVPYYFLEDSHLRVVRTEDATGGETMLVLNTDYSVSGAGNQAGGSITTVAAPAVGFTLRIRRVVPATQETDYVSNDPFPAESHERALDKLTMIAQQTEFEVGRAFKVAETDPIPALVPPVAVRRNQSAGFDANGNLIPLAPGTDSANGLALILADGITPGNGADRVAYDASNTVRDMIFAIKQQLGLIKNIVTDFGAVGDGIADDTAAFNAAIAYANSRGNNDAASTVGTTIFIPDGRYSIGQLNVISKSGCEFVGGSPNGAVILIDSNVGSVFRFGNGTDFIIGGGIRNVKFEYLLQPAISDCVIFMQRCFRLTFTDIVLVNVGTFMNLGNTSTQTAGDITVTNLKGYKANIANALFNVIFGAGLFLNECHVFVGGVVAPVHPNPMTTVPNCNLFNCIFGNWDTVQATNCTFERFDVGLSVVAAAGMVYQNFYFANCIFDYHRRYCVYLESQVGGVVAGMRFDDASWFASWESNTIELVGGGYHENHHFSGKIVLGGANGVHYGLTSSLTRNVVFLGMQINSVNRQGTGSAAMNFVAGAVGFTMSACKGNVDTTAAGFPWRAAFGVVIGANADHYVCSGNKWEGSTNGWSVAVNASPSINRFIGGNAGANYAGGAGLALPASGVTLNNVTPYKVDVHVNGGTVTAITSRGIGLANMTGGFLTMDPGQSLTITYSVAPSFQTFARS